jgi:hypothetical protein
MNKRLPVLRGIVLWGIIAAISSTYLNAQLSLTNIGAAATINFDATTTDVSNGSFRATGFTTSPSSGQLDSDAWSLSGFGGGSNFNFGGSCTSGDCARGLSTGNVSTGGVYAFDTGSGNIALGVQPTSSDFTPGNITLKVENKTGSTFTTISISYVLYVFNDEGRANSYNLSYSTDGTNFIDIPAVDYTSTQASTGNNWSSAINRSISFNLTVADGGEVYLRWTGNDVSGGGSRDEFALDDISVTGAISLPIELASFEAKPTDKTVELEWLVLSETDNDYMAIERSADGKHFTELGTIKGRGDSEEAYQYQFTDQAPMIGQSYYRIRQVDFDGTINYSELKAVTWKNKDLNIRVYPTHTADQLTVEMLQAISPQAKVKIFTPAGQMLRELSLSTENSSQNIDLSNLSPGMYFLTLQLDNSLQTIKIFKQ